MMDAVPEDYNNGNRAFLQSFMARGTMTFPEGQKLLSEIFIIEGNGATPEEVTLDEFNSYVATAATVLSPFDYEIKSMQHQTSKERYYALVNTTSDALTQLATIHTPEEIGFIKRLLDAMFDTYNTKRREIMAVTGMQALEKKIIKGTGDRRESGTQVDKGLTVQEAERCLSALVAEGWLEHSARGFYSLSPRALMELQSWLEETYNDPEDPEEWQAIKLCVACKMIVTVGQRCSDLNCECRIHNICEEFITSKPNKPCPNCKKPWDGKNFVGQKAATKTDDYLKGKRKSGNRRQQEQDAVEEDPEAEAEEEEEGEEEEVGEEDEEEDE